MAAISRSGKVAAPGAAPSDAPELAEGAVPAADRWIFRELQELQEQSRALSLHRRKVMAGVAERYTESLLRFCQVRLGSREAAEDVVQEMLSELEPQLDRLEGVDHLRNLLFRIARQRCADLIEARRRDRVVLSRSDDFQGVAEDSDDLFEMQDRDALRAAIASLPKLEDRILLTLSVDFDMPLRQVATVLEISEGACKMRRHRARLKLRKILLSSRD